MDFAEVRNETKSVKDVDGPLKDAMIVGVMVSVKADVPSSLNETPLGDGDPMGLLSPGCKSGDTAFCLLGHSTLYLSLDNSLG